MLGELWSFQGRYRTLHLTWFAFFLTFVVWFNLAPLATTVKADLGLTVGQIRTVAICNVALTIPARVLIGMLLDKFGPRLTYSTLLVFSVIRLAHPGAGRTSGSTRHIDQLRPSGVCHPLGCALLRRADYRNRDCWCTLRSRSHADQLECPSVDGEGVGDPGLRFPVIGTAGNRQTPAFTPFTPFEVQLKCTIDLHGITGQTPVKATGEVHAFLLTDADRVLIVQPNPADLGNASGIQIQGAGDRGLRELNLLTQGTQQNGARRLIGSNACRQACAERETKQH